MVLLFQPFQCQAENPVMVKGQGRYGRYGKPAGIGGIVSTLYVKSLHQGHIGNGDDALPRIPVHRRERTELTDG